jgi:glycosyltransferase involved in cell wall biosynthesis
MKDFIEFFTKEINNALYSRIKVMKVVLDGKYQPIVIVSNSLSGGGAEKSMLALHQEFLKKGITSYLVALNASKSVNKVQNTIELKRIWKAGIRDTLRNFQDFKNKIEAINPKTIIINCELPELYISLLKLKNKRIISVEHTSVPWHKRRMLGVGVRNILKLKKIEWVTVVKGKKAVWMIGKNAKYIANPYIGESNLKNSFEVKPSLVFIGGIKPNKRPEWVIEAGIKNNLKVDVYGEGQYSEILKARYSKLGRNINFHGFKSNVWEFVYGNSLVVVPSEFEGDGMVIIEAIICRFPLVLARNKDLIKFDLAEKHYFKDLNELDVIIKQNKSSNFRNLIVSDKLAKNIGKNRSLDLISSEWVSFLNKSDNL